MMLTLLEIGFLRPWRLWGLAGVAGLLLVYLVWTLAKHSRTDRRASDLQILFPKRRAWKRHIAVVASILALGSLVLAWATPNGYIQVPRDRATVFLVMDVSLSMEATDVKPTRLKAAQEAANAFVDDLPTGFNISIISFAATPAMLVPPTSDRGQAHVAIDALKLAPSTNIGDAILTAIAGLSLIPPDPDHPNDPAPAVIVLISDGESNTGSPSAKAAAKAQELSVPVFTIAYGTETGYIIDEETGQRNPVPVNKEELRNIANISGGKAYTADSLEKLNEVYDGISRSIGYEQEKAEITEQFVGYAIVLSVIALLGVMSLAARWP
ncbi:MAG: VWA domain-containing protein [Propionibacteriaceae bacterium]|jgi:Ca-activated chloride channel family protein|nr:VWA domain-containing protein [Propionibacteriaceae bacterium]